MIMETLKESKYNPFRAVDSPPFSGGKNATLKKYHYFVNMSCLHICLKVRFCPLCDFLPSLI